MVKKKNTAKADKETPAEAPKGAKGAEKSGKGGGLVSTLITCVALGAASFATVFMLPSRAPAPEATASSDHSDSSYTPSTKPDISDMKYVVMEPLTISLSEGNNLLKIGITLETTDSNIDPSDPQLRDSYMGYLRSLRMEQIRDAAYMSHMRAQLLRRAQLIKGADKVHGILITDFLVR